jgi:FMN phosphatase YigB (HAD superfamily)
MSRVVALDLGGVIVDVDHERCARWLGRSWAACAAAFFDDGLHDRVTVGAIDGDEFATSAAMALGVEPGLVRAAWGAVVELMPAGRALVDDLLAAGCGVHLWSNTDPIHLARMLDALPPGVVTVTASCRLFAMKPQRAFFDKALALGAPALFLDDRADVVAAASAAGVTSRECHGPTQARALLLEAGLLRTSPSRLP